MVNAGHTPLPRRCERPQGARQSGVARGRHYLDRGENDAGLAAFDKALSITGENKETLNNIGSACAEYALFDAAARYYDREIVSFSSLRATVGSAAISSCSREVLSG